jgi:hypothetical protein
MSSAATSLSVFDWRRLDDDCCQFSRSYGASAIGAVASRSMPRGSPSLPAGPTSTRPASGGESSTSRKGVATHRLLHLLREVERRELQEPDGVLQSGA